MQYIKYVALAFALTAAGCDESHDGNPACGSFASTLSIVDSMEQPADTFNTGESIRLRFTVTNRTNEPLELSTAWSCSHVALAVENASAQVIWDEETSINCFAPAPPRVYDPLEAVEYRRTWSQRDFNGAQVAAGSYKMTIRTGSRLTNSSGKVSECGRQYSKSATVKIL